MKFFQRTFTVAIVALGAAVAYHFVSSRSLDQRVGLQEVKMEEVSRQSQRQAESIATQEKALLATREEVSEHARDIEVLEKRVTQAEGKIRGVEGELKATREAAGADRQRIANLESELTSLREEAAQASRELNDLRRMQLQRGEEIERRLRDLEKKAGIVPPAP